MGYVSDCGGPVEETDTSFKARTGETKQKAMKKLNKVVDERAVLAVTNDGTVILSKPNKCRVCHKGFRTTVALKLHYKDNHPECLGEFET